MAKLIVGCGYVGRRLAQTWRARGIDVWVTTRSQQHAEELAADGLRPIVMDVTQAEGDMLPAVDTLVFAVGYDRRAGHSIDDVYVQGLRHTLERCSEPAGRVIYLSSTGVYGQTAGEWVDERSPCVPLREGGKACLAAERWLMSDSRWQGRAILLRLAGIYGPGRIPHGTRLQRGEPIPVAADGFLNLVHVDDIVQVICRADEQLDSSELLCVSDGHPVQRADFYRYLAELLTCDEPQFTAPDVGSTQAERARASKKIRNDRLVDRLAPEWIYPSYQEGLQAIIRHGEWF